MFPFTAADKQWIFDNYPDYWYTDKETIRTTNYLPTNHAYVQSPHQSPHAYNLNQVRLFGGERLVTFYLCDCNYELAAKQLNIQQRTLRSTIARIRVKLLAMGIDALMFDKLCRKEK